MALTEYPALSNLQNATSSFGRPIDTIENGHQTLTNSASNSSTTSNASAYSISSHLMNENACPKLPKSFTSQEPVASKPSSLSDHQCLKPGLLKHPLLYPHAAQSNHHHSSPHSPHSPHAHSPHSAHSPLSPLAHFSHQHLHHHLHHLQQHSNRAARTSAAELLNGAGNVSTPPSATHQALQFKPLCRTQNINSFSRLSDALAHRKIEYTGSGSSLASSSTSGCVSASSSAHHFPLSPLSNSSICSPSSSPSSGPQTPQSGYVQSPLAQSFTADSGLCLSYRSVQSANNGNRNSDTSSGDLSQPAKSAEQRPPIDTKIVDRKYDGSSSSSGSGANASSSGVNTFSGDLKLINKNAGKRMDVGKKATNSLANAGAKLIEQKTAAASFLNLPSRKKDTDDESLLSDYSKADLSSSSGCSGTGNLGSISATSTTNLVSAGNNANLHAAITSKPSLPGTSSSFFHYPNIYNPLKNSRSNTKNNKKLIRFFTVCAYVLCGE